MKKKLTLRKIYLSACKVTLWNEGKSMTAVNGDKEFYDFMKLYKKTVRFGRDIPAFSFVTSSDKSAFSGAAFEIEFDEKYELHGMLFEKLYAILNENYYGLCFDRFHDGQYSGRCLYLNIDKPANALYEYIKQRVNI